MMKIRRAHGNRIVYCTNKSGDRKIRYKTLKDAKFARSARMNDPSTDYIRIYKCPLCQGYHLTKQRPITPNSTVWKDTTSNHMPYNDTWNQSDDEENTHD